MICNGYDKVLDLCDGDLVELNDARGATMRVTKGMVWVTQERDRRDIVLRAGDVWTVERQGVTVIEAHGASIVCLVGEAAQAADSRSRRVRVGERVAAFFRAYGERWLAKRWMPYL
jgi:Protein of unknown function (DUF2917)